MYVVIGYGLLMEIMDNDCERCTSGIYGIRCWGLEQQHVGEAEGYDQFIIQEIEAIWLLYVDLQKRVCELEYPMWI